MTSRVSGAQQTYGPFAVIVGLLFWFYLLAQITLYCAELNSVFARRLWPRSLRSVLQQRADTDVDVDAYTWYPKRANQAENASVSVHIHRGDARPESQEDQQKEQDLEEEQDQQKGDKDDAESIYQR